MVVGLLIGSEGVGDPNRRAVDASPRRQWKNIEIETDNAITAIVSIKDDIRAVCRLGIRVTIDPSQRCCVSDNNILGCKI